MKIRTVRTIRDVRLKTSAGDSLRSLFEVGARGVESIDLVDGLVIIRGDIAGQDVVALPLSSIDAVGLPPPQQSLPQPPRGR